ncbi:hypothetical protein FLONG3_447 [Fusarium longipes]|uniref:Uncharacterized protein n=1 Tax=Fusarium longipes TaxID=694270 RepID=A0A395T9D9_9HYPO|nr:hypothetical protein FLONG3_447 [Fusarium longipes]
MNLALILSLAFGLDFVVAGPCKPQSSDATKETELSDSTTISILPISETTLSTSGGSLPSSPDTTTIASFESTISTALSDSSATIPTEATTTTVSELFSSTSAELTSSTDASSITSADTATSTTLDTSMTTESTTDFTVSTTQTFTDTTLETTTTTPESLTSTTNFDEVSTSTAETTTSLLPIPTLFSLSAQGGPADGWVIHSNGESEYNVWIGSFLTWPSGQFKYEENTGHILVNGNPLCSMAYGGNSNFVSVIVCPSVISSSWHTPLVCDRPTDGSLKCKATPKFESCVTNGGIQICTTTEASWSNMYSSPMSNGAWYQLRFAAADWGQRSSDVGIDLLVTAL